MTKILVKRTFWSGSYTHNKLLYIMYTDMTYEEYKIDIGDYSSCVGGYIRTNFKEVIDVSNLKGMTKEEAHKELDEKAKLWREHSSAIMRSTEESQ